MTDKRRVAILGGGMSGLTAAFELSATQELRDRYDVTIYQHGWRLGGKCASGRDDEHAWRIEEHGLHLWFGLYENAFALMRRCYAALARPAGMPLATVEEAFEPRDGGVLWDNYRGPWVPFDMDFPHNPLVPGDGTPIPGFWEMVLRACTFGWDAWLQQRRHSTESGRLARWAHDVSREIGAVLDPVAHAGSDAALFVARELARHRSHNPEAEGELGHRGVLRRLLHEFREWVWRNHVEPHLDDDTLRTWFCRFDLITAMVIGVIEDEIHERGFDVLNDIELRDWLRAHGAQEVTLQGAAGRAWYCGAFAFPDGDTSRPNVAAGCSVRGMLRQELGYKGAVIYRMQAGMGDAVIAPLYQVLTQRGVHVELFHRVTALHPSTDGSSIGAIDMLEQVHTHGYQPLIDVAGLPCWPCHPLWEQIEGGGALAAAGVDLERTNGPAPEPVTIEEGKDFDHVVLAISVAALPSICSELAADPKRPRFAHMLATTKTVMTQAFQVWMTAPLAALGWQARPEISSTYVEPLDTYSDMSHLLAVEQWPADAGVASIGYFCGVLADVDGDSDAAATQRAKDNAIAFLTNNSQVLWPNFDWDALAAPAGATGPARFDAQFWRANFQLTERYVLTPAGTVGARLSATDSEWSNLVFAGDWTRTGLDLGCVEAAVISGMQAARGVCGSPTYIAAEDHSWFGATSGP